MVISHFLLYDILFSIYLTFSSSILLSIPFSINSISQLLLSLHWCFANPSIRDGDSKLSLMAKLMPTGGCFALRNTSSIGIHRRQTYKMIVAGLAMKGPALTYMVAPLAPTPSSMGELGFFYFKIFLWQFKPEWRVILPVPDDEEESEVKPQELVREGSFDEQLKMVKERKKQ
jgi:hypothetical protein